MGDLALSEGPFAEDYHALELLNQGLRQLGRALQEQVRGNVDRVSEELVMEAAVLLDQAHETHLEVRASLPHEYWLTDPWIRGRLLERSLSEIAVDRELLMRLGREWRERAGVGGVVRDPVGVDYGYSRLLANEVRLLIELGLPFTVASRVVRQAWPSGISRRGNSTNPYELMMSRQPTLSLLAASSFSLQWFGASLAIRLHQALAQGQDDPGWVGGIHRILRRARARSAIAVLQSADTYIEPGGDPLTVFLTGIQVALEVVDNNFDGAASGVNEIVAGFIGVTIPEHFMESI